VFAAKRAALTDRLTDIVLAEGLNDLGLRPAAARLGTSDRMLLYYFETKADLIVAVLTRMSERLARVLESSAAGERQSADSLLGRAWMLFENPQIVPFMRVWAEVTSRGTRGEEPYRKVASQTILRWLAWIEERLDMPAGKKRRQNAAAILTILEGATLLEMSNPGSTEGVRILLTKAMRNIA
jgi:AcrR family transcriptional regulator